MTVQEIQTMIRQNMVLYRNVAKPLTDKEADLLIATWADGFRRGSMAYEPFRTS